MGRPPEGAPTERPRPLRVLVIDDERNIRTTLAACLESMGCSVGQAASRAAALSAVRG